jgi:hypothetical protein
MHYFASLELLCRVGSPTPYMPPSCSPAGDAFSPVTREAKISAAASEHSISGSCGAREMHGSFLGTVPSSMEMREQPLLSTFNPWQLVTCFRHPVLNQTLSKRALCPLVHAHDGKDFAARGGSTPDSKLGNLVIGANATLCMPRIALTEPPPTHHQSPSLADRLKLGYATANSIAS